MKKLLVLILALGFSASLAQSGLDTYVYQTFGGVDTLDPEGAYDTASGTALENLYETLYAYSGESITEFEPALATDHEISEDGLTYTYTLRDGVTFHSGNAFSCKDVEYSIERILVMNDPDSGVWFQSEALLGAENGGANADGIVATQATMMAEEAGTDVEAEDFDPLGVEGFDYDAAYVDVWNMISSSVECPDGPEGLTVQFNLPAVDPAFFAKLLYTNASIIDSAWAAENGAWDGTEATWREWVGFDPRGGYLHDNASGTGAYQLVSWDGTDLVAEAFSDYWDGAPEIQTVLYQVVDELATRILNLQNGVADRITLGSDTDWATLETQVRDLEGVAVYDEEDWLSTSAGALHFVQNIETTDNAVNVGSGELDGNGVPSDFFADENVRKAFSYVFDPQILIEELYLGNGQLLTMALPPSFLGYDESVPTYEYDPEQAEEFFCAAFDATLCDVGFEMTISYNEGNTTRQAIAEIMKANIEDINSNFKVNVRGIQWPDFLAARSASELPLSIVSWAPDYADPDNFMYTYYNSNGYYGAQLGFEDSEIDQLINDARTSTDETERETLYSQVANRAYELAPFLTYPTARVFVVTRDNVEGVYYNPMYSHYYLWKDVSKN